MPSASSVIAGRALVLIEAIDKTGKVFPKIMSRFRNFSSRVQALNRAGVTGFDAYGAAIKSLFTPLKKLEMSWDGLGKFINYTLLTISKKLQRLGQSALNLGFQLTLAAGLLAMPLKDSIEEAARLDTELLKAKAAAELTDEQLQSLTATVKATSRETTFLSTEIAKVAKELARAGLQGEKLEAAILPVLNLSRATDYDPASAAEQFVQAITVFGIGVDGYKKVADNFVTAANESIVDMDDLGASFSYVAGTAEATRFGLTRTLAALAQLSFSGLTGSKGGTSLNQFLESLGQKSEDIEEAFGISVFGDNGQLRNPLEILSDMGDVLRALPDEAKLPHLTRIFNVRGARAVKALKTLENLTSMIDKMETQLGIATDQARILDRGFEGSIRRILRSVSLLKVEIGEAFREPLRKLSMGLELYVDKLLKVIKSNQQATYEIGLVVIQVFAAGTALLTFGVAANIASFALQGLAVAATVAGKAMKLLVEVFLLPWKKATLLIAAVVGSIVLLGVSLSKISETVNNSLSKGWAKLKQEGAAAWDTIKDSAIGLMVQIQKLWKIYEPLAKMFTKASIALSFQATILTLRVVTNALEIIFKVITKITKALRAVIWLNLIPIKALILAIKAGILALRVGFTVTFAPLILTWKLLKGIWAIIKKAAIALKDWFLYVQPLTKQFALLKDIALEFWGILKTVGKIVATVLVAPFVMVSKIFKGMVASIRLFRDALHTIITAPLRAVLGIVTWIHNAIKATWETLKEFGTLIFPIQDAFMLIKDIFAQILDIGKSLFALIFGKDAFGNFLNSILEVGQAIHDYILAPLRELLGYLTEIAEMLQLLSGRKQPNYETEKLNLLKQQAALGAGHTQTISSSAITIQKGSAQDLETTFADSQQAEQLHLLQQIEDRLRIIETQQRESKAVLQGI